MTLIFAGAYMGPLILISFSCLGIVTIQMTLMLMYMDTLTGLFIGRAATES